MYLTILDLILILILFLFIAFGFVLGLVQTIGALIGVVLGAFLAGTFYEPFGRWLAPFFLGNSNAAKIVAFILIFTISNRLVGLVFWLINKIFNLISIIPFTKSLNRILGAILGLVEGILVLGVILFFLTDFGFSEWFNSIVAASKVAEWLIWLAGIVTPFLPGLIEKASTYVG